MYNHDGWFQVLTQDDLIGVDSASRYIWLLLQVCLEHCFHLLTAQVGDVEILCGISFLSGFGYELEFMLAAYEIVVSAALRNGHHGEKNVFQVPLAF